MPDSLGFQHNALLPLYLPSLVWAIPAVLHPASIFQRTQNNIILLAVKYWTEQVFKRL